MDSSLRDAAPFGYTDAFDTIRAIERSEEPCRSRFFGIRAWPIFRMRIYFRLIERGARVADLQDPRRRNARGLRRLIHVALPFLHDLAGFPAECLWLLRRRDELYFTDGVSFLREGEVVFERILGPFVERARSAGAKADLASFVRVKRNDVEVDTIAGTMRVAGVLAWAMTFLAPRATWSHMANTLAQIAAAGGPTLNVRSVLREILVVAILGRYFRFVFKQSGIKSIYLNTYYHMYGWGACLGARGAGIDAIDVQHGVQGDYHAAYSDFPEACGDLDVLPTRFACWTKPDAEQINTWAARLASRHQAFVAGQPLLERWLDKAGELPARFRVRMDEALGELSARRIVLYTGTGERGEAAIVGRLARLFKEDQAFVLLVRPHPGYLDSVQDFADALEAEMCPVVDPSVLASFPLYGLLSCASLHVTTVSTTVLEAQAFGVPNIVIGVSGRKMYTGRLRDGRTLYIEDATQLSLEAITRLAGAPRDGGPQIPCSNRK